MERIKSYVNEIFKFATIFCLSFIWCNYYIRNTVKSLIVSFLVTIGLDLIIGIFYKKKYNKYQKSIKDQKEITYISNQLLFSSKQESNNYIKKIFNISKLEIVINNEKYKLFNYLNKTEFSKEDGIFVVNELESKKLSNGIIFAQNFNSEILSTLNSISTYNIICSDISDLYLNFIKEKNIKPEEKIKLSENRKNSIKEIVKISLNKSNSKKYFIFGLSTLFLSFFAFYNIYYIVFSSILFSLSLLSYFINTKPISFKHTKLKDLINSTEKNN